MAPHLSGSQLHDLAEIAKSCCHGRWLKETPAKAQSAPQKGGGKSEKPCHPVHGEFVNPQKNGAARAVF
jgi:hypothetical protein